MSTNALIVVLCLKSCRELAPQPRQMSGVLGANLKKLISKVGFQLKGTGWYETDFKNKDSKTKKQTEGGEDKKSTKSDKKEKKNVVQSRSCENL